MSMFRELYNKLLAIKMVLQIRSGQPSHVTPICNIQYRSHQQPSLQNQYEHFSTIIQLMYCTSIQHLI